MGKNRNKKLQRLALAVAVPKITEARPKRAGKRRANKPSRSPGLGTGLVRAFYQTLQDPFEFGPVRLGYDCYVPTMIASAYARGSFVVNADGSFALGLQAQLGNMVIYNNSGAAGTTWTGVAPANASGILTATNTARIVSAGIRCVALFPATSAPGILAVASSPFESPSSMATYYPTAVFALASAELAMGSSGAAITTRPTDNTSFSFRPETVQSTGFGSSTFNRSAAFIAGKGWPVDTVVWFEAVTNLEGLPTVTNSSTGINDNLTPQPSLADEAPSPESLMSKLRPILGSSVTLDAAEIGLRAVGAGGAATALRSVRAAFGRHRRLQQAFGAVPPNRQTRENSMVIIEEMKEDL